MQQVFSEAKAPGERPEIRQDNAVAYFCTCNFNYYKPLIHVPWGRKRLKLRVKVLE